MNMEDRDGWIWMDGHWTPWRDAKVHALTHTLHYGLGCFEGIRAYPGAHGPAVFRLAEHVERLFDSARILGLDLAFTPGIIADACREVVRRNELTSAYIRPLVFLGAEKAGIDPAGASTHVMIAAWPWGAYLGDGAMEHGIRVKVSSFAKHHVNVQMCRAKSVSSYTNSILACREARAEGYDEAVLLDTSGFVAEGPGENIFIVKRGTLWEPDNPAALDGITRRSLQALAAELGYGIRTRRLTRDDLYIADEAFFSGTAAEVTPIVEVDRHRIGSGAPGPVTRALQQAFFACVRGESDAHREWLTPVASA